MMGKTLVAALARIAELEAEVERLKEIITDVGSSGIVSDGDWVTVQVYGPTWKECYQMALDEIEEDSETCHD